MKYYIYKSLLLIALFIFKCVYPICVISIACIAGFIVSGDVILAGARMSAEWLYLTGLYFMYGSVLFFVVDYLACGCVVAITKTIKKLKRVKKKKRRL